MDTITAAQSITEILIHLLPYWLNQDNDTMLHMRKHLDRFSWTAIEKIWEILQDKADADIVLKSAMEDVASNPTDSDAQAALRLQIKKLLQRDPAIVSKLQPYIGNLKQILYSIEVGGDVTHSNLIAGNHNVIQDGSHNVYIGKIERVLVGKENRMAEMREIKIDFSLPDGSYPTFFWIEKTSLLVVRGNKVVKEWWEPDTYNRDVLKRILLDEINKYSRMGWELVESHPDNLFLVDSDFEETLVSSIGSWLGVSLSTTWKHWRIYRGAKFHIRKYLE